MFKRIKEKKDKISGETVLNSIFALQGILYVISIAALVKINKEKKR